MELEPRCLQGHVGNRKERMGLRKEEPCSCRVTLFSFPIRNFNSNDYKKGYRLSRIHLQVTFGLGPLLVTSGLDVSGRPQAVALGWLGSQGLVTDLGGRPMTS